MEKNREIDNGIFMAAFAGVVLLIISVATSLVSATPPAIFVSTTAGMSAIVLLFNAISKEKKSSNQNELLD